LKKKKERKEKRGRARAGDAEECRAGAAERVGVREARREKEEAEIGATDVVFILCKDAEAIPGSRIQRI
jgi:hypothetical protein